MDAAAVTPDSFNFITLFMRADWVVKAVMVGLCLASLWSWAVILDKTFRFASLNRQAEKFEAEVDGGQSLEDIANKAGERPRHALPRMLQAALREWRDYRLKPMNDSQTAFLVQRIDRVLDTIIARESARVEDGLGLLAIVATASPFVGLSGTVWGIMHAFQNIALQKNTNLAVVAPAIAEALFATAIGLVAAIPAVLAYNQISNSLSRFAGRLDNFGSEFSAILSRQSEERA